MSSPSSNCLDNMTYTKPVKSKQLLIDWFSINDQHKIIVLFLNTCAWIVAISVHLNKFFTTEEAFNIIQYAITCMQACFTM